MTGAPNEDNLPFSQQQIEAVTSAFPSQTQPLLQQWVMSMYGAAMLQVQAFELQLASLVLVVTAQRKPPTKNLQRQLRKSLSKINHLLEHATTQEMRRELEGRIDADLLDEIDFLLPWRNRLAHRYLRQRLPSLPGKTIKATADMAFELLEISNAFTAASARIEEAKTKAMSQWPGPGAGMPDGLVEEITLVMSELILAKPLRFETSQPRGD